MTAPEADPVFADPRLAELYDAFDGPRTDLVAYRALVEELGVRSVLDVGCGTGELACSLAARGLDVVGLDPARASLDVARRKPHADRVRWVHGGVAALPPLQVDLVTMTGNVAQVFLTDEEWAAALRAVRAALRPGGRFVFESRRPERRAWQEWTPERSAARVDVPGERCGPRWRSPPSAVCWCPSGGPSASRRTAPSSPRTRRCGSAAGRSWPPR